MTNEVTKLPTSNILKSRKPEWTYDAKGRQRLNGRWNLQRVAERLIEKPFWHTVDDIARIVYGTTTPTFRLNVRKHIPGQRRFMLHQLGQPIVTRFGEHGMILAVKLYNSGLEEDKIFLRMDLDRALSRKELSDKNYDELQRLFLLEDQSA